MRSILLTLLLCCMALPARAMEFPRPPEMAEQVAFWRSIFSEYSEHQVVIHHRDDLTAIFRVLDFADVAPLLTEDELRLHMRQEEEKAKEELQRLLLRLSANPTDPSLPPAAIALREQLKDHPAPDPYARAAERLRGQRGLREKFERAIMRSGRYLPYMEAVFEQAGLPVLLTRLPLVESSFNERAYSHSGAAGVWQFMPATARVYMRFDEVADDRRDPWTSTAAAAAHLRDDYALLQDWPLAVTAYNFGRYGVSRALEETGASSLPELIEHYDGGRWGFAAKNFYAEFLAAVEVEQNALKYFGPLRRDAPEEFEEVETRHYVRYDTLSRLAAADLKEFARLNPRYSSAVVDGSLYVPPGQKIRVPAGRAHQFRNAYASLGQHELYSEQRVYFRNHRVRRGDTLSELAQRYDSSVSAIRRANNLNSRGFIRIGQTLKIPPRGGAVPAVYTVEPGDTLAGISQRYNVTLDYLLEANDIARPELLRIGQRLQLPASAVNAPTWHQVRPGQTVAAIARQYGTSIAAIARENGLDDIHLIRPGQRLRLPSR